MKIIPYCTISIYHYMINGIWIPICCFWYYMQTNNAILPIYVWLKAFPTNYYIVFSHLYSNPSIIKYKHMIRLTDSGHILNFLFYFWPETFASIAHNILFIITFAYFICTYGLNMKDTDGRRNKIVIYWIHDLHEIINHCLPYTLVVKYLLLEKNNSLFMGYSVFYSYIWLYVWFCCIYIPWNVYTGDCVYSVLSKETPWKIKISVFLGVNFMVLMANEVGKYLCSV